MGQAGAGDLPHVAVEAGVRERGGSIQIADSTNFPAPRTVAAALVTVKPGSMRELHWHPNADDWQYYMKGSARMTVFITGPHANTTDFRPAMSAWSGATAATTSRTPATMTWSSSKRSTKRSRWPTGSATCRQSSFPRT
jgi:hypothetical protein